MSNGEGPSPLHVLHIILTLRPTNGQYNEHCLPLLNVRKITICTYFKAEITPPAAIRLFDGGSSIGGFFRALRAALAADEYHIIHVHTPHAGLLLLTTLFMAGQYRQLKSSTVHTIQNSYQNFTLRHKLMFLPSFPLFRRLVFCSRASYDSFPWAFKWLGRSRMTIVPNAVDIERIDRVLKSARAAQPNRFKIVSVGLIKIKNPSTVLAAFRHTYDPASDLVFLGEGALRTALAREIAKSGLEDRVTLAGIIPRDGVFEHFAQADLFVSASWGEGLPVAVLEAMASRCPVVLSDIPPHREIAEGANFIPLVPPWDARGFAREIAKCKEMATSEREDIGDRCRALVEERYSLQVMHAAYGEIYSQMTNGRVFLGAPSGSVERRTPATHRRRVPQR